jgi:hypothetical protein
MDLNIVNIAYLFFRLAPFIIVSYFTLQSIFNQDLKGLIYLVGLIIATVFTIIIGNIIPKPDVSLAPTTDESKKYSKIKCNTLTLGSNEPLSRLPLSQTTFGYTLAYLSYFIGVNNLTTQNIPMFVIFPTLILADIFWSVSNSCSSNELLLSALIIGGGVGAIWGLIIDSTNMTNLTYYSGVSNNEVCSQPKRSLYRCRTVKKNSASTPSS